MLRKPPLDHSLVHRAETYTGAMGMVHDVRQALALYDLAYRRLPEPPTAEALWRLLINHRTLELVLAGKPWGKADAQACKETKWPV